MMMPGKRVCFVNREGEKEKARKGKKAIARI
jgi:hypothetical protein